MEKINILQWLYYVVQKLSHNTRGHRRRRGVSEPTLSALHALSALAIEMVGYYDPFPSIKFSRATFVRFEMSAKDT